ncbi:nitrate ABC transporter permease [Emcibacter sp.]|uniref:nitrate ABC transporter permease n=1 Tax=Emcibacter sp. TaxID=1979954 RepID=UPI003A8D97B0
MTVVEMKTYTPEPETEQAEVSSAEEVVTTSTLEGEPYEDRMKPIEDLMRSLVHRFFLPGLTFLLCIGIWVAIQTSVAPDLPGPVETWEKAKEIFAEPFYVYGPNDMGIGWQVLYSIGRVLAGFALATIVGVPVGFMIGLSDTFSKAWTPLIKILRPVSPLAWLPIGLLIFKAVNPSAIFVIFITSIWPVIINTAAGVRTIPEDYMNVASVLKLGRLDVARKILLPATLPHILTGMQLSLSTAWMVIVAAEMLTGGIGIGFYIWDEWNNLSVTSIIVAILVIGCVGILLEACMGLVQRRFSYGNK